MRSSMAARSDSASCWRVAAASTWASSSGRVASAQATAELAGRVTDESGGVLPGVTVTATQTDTGFTRTVVSDAAGGWVMPNLPTGPYRLEVSLQGFRTYVQTGNVGPNRFRVVDSDSDAVSNEVTVTVG